MANRKKDEALLGAAGRVSSVIGALKKLPAELRSAKIEAVAAELQSLGQQLTAADDARKHLESSRAAKAAELAELLVRIRAGVTAVYGRDSAECTAVGIVRQRDRKRPVRKPKAPATEPAPAVSAPATVTPPHAA